MIQILIKVNRYAYAGCDAPIHIAEEVPKPGVKIPAVMNLTMLIGVSSSLKIIKISYNFIYDSLTKFNKKVL